MRKKINVLCLFSIKITYDEYKNLCLVLYLKNDRIFLIKRLEIILLYLNTLFYYIRTNSE